MKGSVLAFLGMFAMGCAPSVKFMAFNSSPKRMTERRAESVEIFKATRPARPFVEVGEIQAGGGNAFTDEFDYLSAIRREAAKTGCDAVMLVGEDKAAVAGRVWAYEKVETVRGVCVVYSD